MPHIDNLDEVLRLRTELAQLREAGRRLDIGVFKEAVLSIRDMAHGVAGIPGPGSKGLQKAETTLNIDREVLVPFIRTRIECVISALAEFGFTV